MPKVITNNNSTSPPSSSSRTFLFQQLYQIFSFVFRYIQSILIIKPLQTIQHIKSKRCTKSTIKTKTKVQQHLSLQYYKGKTLVLDLDETLVHSVRLGTTTETNLVSPSIKKKTIEVTSDKQSILYEVYKRPHVDFFLSTVSTYCVYDKERERLINLLIDQQMV